MSQDYIGKLEQVIKQMLIPLKNIPLKLVIENLTDKTILPIENNDYCKKIIKDLSLVATKAGLEVNKKGIWRPRPNEVGNDIEPFVKNALNNIGYKADCPTCTNGKKMVAGYPDLCFFDSKNKINYLECKSYNVSNINTTQRSFYLSPTINPKVTADAHHLLISYEVEVVKSKKNLHLYKCKAWKLLDIAGIDVDVKYEFFSDNKRLYSNDFVIAEGKL